MKLCVPCIVAAIAVSSGAAVLMSVPSAGAAATAEAPAAAMAYTVDTMHSSVIFKAKHNNVANFYGRFDHVSGSFALAEGGAFDIAIKADSVHSGFPGRDDHLRNPDFFSAKEFPTMNFKSTSVKAQGTDTFEVAGNLTFRGVTKPMTVVVKATGTGESKGKKIAGMETKFTIKRTDFGNDYGVKNGALSDEVELIVSLEGVAG